MRDTKMLLTILIPTYNRAHYLEQNIRLLLRLIEELEFKNIVKIIISNNCSTDNTYEILNEFHDNDNIDIFEQKENIGLEKNAVFCLEKASSLYVMYMGDDDYITKEYLAGVVEYLKQGYSCIVPSIVAIDTSGSSIGENIGRDLQKSTTVYKKGFEGALALFEKGHQLSGVTFLRENTLEEYLKRDIRDIHPFMFFVGFNCLRGESVHFTKFPVKVTQPPQANKDWGYGKDGLIIARLKSTYGVFNENHEYLKKAQKIILWIDRGYGYRFLKSKQESTYEFFKIIFSSKYLLLSNKFYFLYLEIGIIVKKLVRGTFDK